VSLRWRLVQVDAFDNHVQTKLTRNSKHIRGSPSVCEHVEGLVCAVEVVVRTLAIVYLGTSMRQWRNVFLNKLDISRVVSKIDCGHLYRLDPD
jgi:hypothetical protein